MRWEEHSHLQDQRHPNSSLSPIPRNKMRRPFNSSKGPSASHAASRNSLTTSRVSPTSSRNARRKSSTSTAISNSQPGRHQVGSNTNLPPSRPTLPSIVPPPVNNHSSASTHAPCHAPPVSPYRLRTIPLCYRKNSPDLPLPSPRTSTSPSVHSLAIGPTPPTPIGMSITPNSLPRLLRLFRPANRRLCYSLIMRCRWCVIMSR